MNKDMRSELENDKEVMECEVESFLRECLSHDECEDCPLYDCEILLVETADGKIGIRRGKK